MFSREQVQILSNSEEKNCCESVKTRNYVLQSKNNFRWLFIVILKQNVRIRVFFSYDIQHYLSFTLKLHETYIPMLGQLYTLRGTSHVLNRTSDFYQDSSPGQVTDFFWMSPENNDENDDDDNNDDNDDKDNNSTITLRTI